MDETKYSYNGEYAVKCTIPVTEETKDTNVEIYDRYNNTMLKTKDFTVDELVDIITETEWTWKYITEEEYNRIINS